MLAELLKKAKQLLHLSTIFKVPCTKLFDGKIERSLEELVPTAGRHRSSLPQINALSK